MGRSTYTAYGHGMTESEALRDATERDRVENGHQDGYSGTIGSRTTINSKCVKQPKPAKKCLVTRLKNKPKFSKRFHIHCQDHAFHDYKNTKPEAITRAKEMALKYGLRFVVETTMIPDSSAEVAEITPAKSELGTWKFWGEARD